ncbi:serine/threonine protein kinase [Minicystis rosea]|nr:serine/threonine protein kinase [Minicystis rosea]
MTSAPPDVRRVGRYMLHGEIAAGGMATVHVGRLLGPVGFTRTVAIKRLHAQFAKDPEFVSMFLDEARLAGRIQHPNVCATLDVVATNGELFLVMEYLQGETLSRLIRASYMKKQHIPPAIVVAVIASALHGLHAAHEARDERGEPLNIVHRDISPQNILINRDGVPKILDFGVAKASGRFHSTREGNVKGKLPYMSPEQLRGQPIDRRTDVYAAFVCCWEALTSRKLFRGDNEGSVLVSVLEGAIDPPSKLVDTVPAALDAVVMAGISRNPAARFATAKEGATALERALRPALMTEVAEWVEQIAGEALNRQAVRVAEIESRTGELPELADILSGLSDAVTRVANVAVPPEAVPSSTGVQAPEAKAPPEVEPSDAASTPDASAKDAREAPAPEAASAPTPASTAAPAQPDAAPRSGTSGRLLVAAAAIAVLGGGVLVASRGSSPAASPAPGAGSVVTAAPSATVTAAPSASATVTAEPSASATVTAALSASAAPSVAPSASAAGTPPAGRGTWKPPAGGVPPTVKPAKPDCSTPYRIGPNGEKIYKRECM